jgi:hypothetical protein
MLGYLGGTRRTRRNLASAFVGEVSAIMTLLEGMTQPHANGIPQSPNEAEHTEFVPPRCDLYAANAGRLDVFDAPLPNQLAHFYTRLAALPGFARARAAQGPTARNEPAPSSRPVSAELEHLLEEGEDLLRNLRPFVSKPHSATITRA